MAKKICNICNTRPVSKGGLQDACDPCWDEGGWENTHNDNHHDELSEVAEAARTAGAVELRKLAPKAGIKNGAKHKSAELRAMILAAVEREQTGCWICHPELNEARMEKKIRKPRKASEGERPSRKGQKINVPLRARGEAKAAVVIKAAGEEKAALNSLMGGAVSLTVALRDGVTLYLAWDAEGRYDYAEAYVSVGGKKKAVRNVAEALRIINS